MTDFCSLEGRIALVTGGSRGIGRTIALGLGRAGAQVVVGYRSGADEAEAVAKEIGGRSVQADVSDPEQAARLVEEAGDIEILVNNAGLTRDGLIVRMSDEDWRTVIDTNLGGVFATCRAAARGMMRRRSGAIVNLSSVVGVHGNPGQTNYAASKAGIIGFTKALARELAIRNVRANVIAPGLHPDRPHRGAAGGRPRSAARRDAARPAGLAGGRGGSGTLPLLRRSLVHHRRSAPRRRRAWGCRGRRWKPTGIGAES